MLSNSEGAGFFFNSIYLSVKKFQNVIRLQRVITLRHFICFQCNLLQEPQLCLLLVAIKSI